MDGGMDDGDEDDFVPQQRSFHERPELSPASAAAALYTCSRHFLRRNRLNLNPPSPREMELKINKPAETQCWSSMMLKGSAKTPPPPPIGEAAPVKSYNGRRQEWWQIMWPSGA